ncbi:conserved hypothetical protein [Neospora caninum Liverpool]|uniref:Uncharacterized protein n=1 Tax=Neospora caninum (strain Liverpool) TaxID=572307 RepID=F0VM55_NEOCL|nr:conserved hypothetical protein [Neospora caninum Liverpool]CBZ54333.1 conserved hypothetical protein [Neospora caninum Liverpool]CEL69038.1 TPA: hypothetical protein BN1204_047640 [Neospora caninum Liverpool]|eukprot:XP_003884364.1 conserved hypothetical protein [Neospora caninum Liverpool]
MELSGSSTCLTKNEDLQYAIKRILKQHQRECEDAAEFGKAREAQAALNELQYRCEFESLCRLFCYQYQQLSDADEAHRNQLHSLETQWKTVQLPALVDRIRKWKSQLQARQSAERQSFSWQEAGEDSKSKPKFKKEAFDLQKKMQYLGHQGRYDEAEELQRRLEAQQRLDAQEHEASRQARRERQAARLTETHEAERAAFESKVERLTEYYNRQNAAMVETLRRKHQGLRKSITHVQGLELQKALYALKCLKPDEGVCLVCSAVSTHIRRVEKAQCETQEAPEDNHPTVFPSPRGLSLPVSATGGSLRAPSSQASPRPSASPVLGRIETPQKKSQSSLPPVLDWRTSPVSLGSRRCASEAASQRSPKAMRSRIATKPFQLLASPRTAREYTEKRRPPGGVGKKGTVAAASARGRSEAEHGRRGKQKLPPTVGDGLHKEILNCWKEAAEKVIKDRKSSASLR